MSSELAVVEEEQHGLTLFGTNDPLAVIEQATRLATPLAQLIRDRNLASRIQDREHVRVEGWTLLGSMLGVFPITEWTQPIVEDGVQVGWAARVVAKTLEGATVGAAEAECRHDEPTQTRQGVKYHWKDRASYAVRSMAQTRATSKALRMPLGFVMQLAGFDPTPAEEMPASNRGALYPSDPAGKCPSCGASVWDNRSDHEKDPKKPAFKCSDKKCEGGGLRDKDKPDGPRWPWATWSADFFDSDVQDDGGGDVVDRMNRKVTAHIIAGGEQDEVVAMDRAEAAVFEAATELGFGWPNQSLGRDELNAILEAAKEKA